MELNNEFRVAVPAAKTWEFLTDVERVAPCLPGATLLSVDGDEFTGTVKVKVGPITVSYQGEAAFAEKDAAAQRMVLKANGKETRGNGNVAAVITAQLKDDGDATSVLINTDLTISGKAAQFGRGVLADVAGPDVVDDLQLIVSELFTNALEHGTAGTVRVEVRSDHDSAGVTVHSHGPTPEVGAANGWHVADPSAPRGRGLGIVRRLADDLIVERDGDDFVVTAVRMLRHPSDA